MKKKIDLDSTDSEHKGFKGLFEKTLRRFRLLIHLITLMPVYLLASFILGLSLVPAITLFRYTSILVSEQNFILQNTVYGLSIALGYFIYGTSLVFVSPLMNFLLRTKLKEWRGPYYSFESLKWLIHNGLTYLARYTFLEFITPSPFSLLFYRMMGMKIGYGTVINTTWISDPSLIELGNKVTIGGSVTIVAHYGQGGLLIIAPVKVGNNCTIGIKSTIMGGVIIGDDVKILPHSAVLPKTIIPSGETWGGVPAVKIEINRNIKLAVS